MFRNLMPVKRILKIPVEACGLVIGRGGSALRKIQNTCKVEMRLKPALTSFTGRGGVAKEIVISGFLTDCLHACKLIIEKLARMGYTVEPHIQWELDRIDMEMSRMRNAAATDSGSTNSNSETESEELPSDDSEEESSPQEETTPEIIVTPAEVVEAEVENNEADDDARSESSDYDDLPELIEIPEDEQREIEREIQNVLNASEDELSRMEREHEAMMDRMMAIRIAHEQRLIERLEREYENEQNYNQEESEERTTEEVEESSTSNEQTSLEDEMPTNGRPNFCQCTII